MLYGFRDGAEWVVIAGDNTAEFEEFLASGVGDEVDAFSIMSDDRYRGLNAAVRLPGETTVSVVEIGQPRAADVQRTMRVNDPDYDDIYSKHSSETRSLKEIYGLVQHDPWDKRTEKEKIKDGLLDKKRQEMKGKVSGESFSANQGGSEKRVSVQDIRGTIDKTTGKVTIDEVIAQKGLWDKSEKPLVEKPGLYWQVTVANLMGNTVASLRRAVESANASRVASSEEPVPFEPIYEADIVANPSDEPPMLGVDGSPLSEIDDTVVFWFNTEDEANVAAADLQDILAHVGHVSIDMVDEFGRPGNPMRIKSTSFKTFYRCDFHGVDEAGFDAMVAKLPTLEVNKLVVDRGTFDEDGSVGVWTASGLLRLAEKLNSALLALDPTLTSEVYAVNRDNERLVPKGTTVVDTTAPREIGPRPWNARRYEWLAMSDEEREEEIKKNVKGDEFIFSGSWDMMNGSTVYIVPFDYFESKGEMFKESLPLKHILPEDYKEIEPGVYRATARKWQEATFPLGRAKIRESMSLRIYLNHLGL